MFDDRVDAMLDDLRDGGGRVTQSRRVVIGALLDQPGHHVTAADVVTAVRAVDPQFYESTVYRTLDRLVELGSIERVQMGPGAAVYHLPHRPHLHVVCDRCRAVLEVDAGVLDQIADVLDRKYQFVLRPSACTLTGTCRRCAATDVAP